MIGGLAASHYFGIRLGAAVNNIFTIGKLLPLFAFCAAGLVLLPVDIPFRAPLPGASSLQQAGLLLMFAMSGFENASIPSEEAVNPRKNMPLALIGSVCLVAVLFFTIQVVAMAALPELGKSATPLASAAQSFLGPVGGLMLTAGAVLSTAGSNHVNLLVGPRVLYALGRDGQLPAAVARLHPVYRTPAFSIVLYATAGWALALATGFAQLAALSAIARLVVYASTCLAVPVLRRRQPSLPEGFRLAGGAGVPALALLVCAWLLAGSSWIQAMIAGAALLAGGLLYALVR
jgi:amino acid transporter